MNFVDDLKKIISELEARREGWACRSALSGETPELLMGRIDGIDYSLGLVEDMVRAYALEEHDTLEPRVRLLESHLYVATDNRCPYCGSRAQVKRLSSTNGHTYCCDNSPDCGRNWEVK